MSLTAAELRARIDAAEDIGREPAVIPEWGIAEEDGCFLRGLTGTQRDGFEASMVEQRGNRQRMKYDNIRARLVSLCLVDSEDVRLYSEADTKALGKKSAKVLDRLFDQSMKLSGLTEDDIAELAEDFDDAPNDEDGSA